MGNAVTTRGWRAVTTALLSIPPSLAASDQCRLRRCGRNDAKVQIDLTTPRSAATVSRAPGSWRAETAKSAAYGAGPRSSGSRRWQGDVRHAPARRRHSSEVRPRTESLVAGSRRSSVKHAGEAEIQINGERATIIPTSGDG